MDETEALKIVAEASIAQSLTRMVYELVAIQDLMRLTECLDAEASLDLNEGINAFKLVIDKVANRQINQNDSQ